MSARVLHTDDMVVMTPPTAAMIARQESKRLVFVSLLLGVLLCVCALSAAQMSQFISVNYTIGFADYMSRVF